MRKKILNHYVPVLGASVKKMLQPNGCVMIDLPKTEETVTYAGQRKVRSINLRCQGLVVKTTEEGEPRLVDKCNGSLKTIVGRGTGDQTELISCSKCRTAYIVRQKWDDEGHLEIQTTVYDMSDRLKALGEGGLDKDFNYWIAFNPEKK